MSFNMYNSNDINFWSGASHTMALVGNNVGIGTTTNSVQNGSIYFSDINAINTYIKAGHKTGSASGADFLACYYDGTQIGGVAQADTTGVAFNTSSE